MILDTIRSMIYGHAIGDALGVPVEFESREALTAHPVTDMQGAMAHMMFLPERGRTIRA